MVYLVRTGRICLFFLFNVLYLDQYIFASVRYSRNAAFDGHGCQSDDAIFHKDKIVNHILCSSLCTQHEACVGFFYIAEIQKCIGCRINFQNRTTVVADTVYYSRDGLRNSSDFDGHRCVIDKRISVSPNIPTLAHCASTCFANDDCQSYFHRPDTKQCSLCRVAYGISGDNAGIEQWSDSIYGSRYSYLGCFDDYVPRILDDRFTNTVTMTTEMCVNRCVSEGRFYALTEAGTYCDCGNQLKLHGNYTDARCNAPCAGDASQMCGSGWAGSVYIIRHY